MKHVLLCLLIVLVPVSLRAGTAEGDFLHSGNTNTTPAQDAYGTVVRIAGGNKCVATEAAPEHVEGEEVALSCKLNGDLRTTAGAGGGGTVQTLTIASGVTTNTTTAAVAGVRGEKTYWARVAGTGAVTATVEFLGCHSTTVSAAECVSLGTIALSGTTSKYNVPTPAVGTANYPYMADTPPHGLT